MRVTRMAVAVPVIVCVAVSVIVHVGILPDVSGCWRRSDRIAHGNRAGDESTVYNYLMAKNVIRISEAEAASDFSSLMSRVRAGAEVIIENGERPVAILHGAEATRRSISECIALAKLHEDETGKAPILDPEFAEDVESIIGHRKQWNPPAWE